MYGATVSAMTRCYSLVSGIRARSLAHLGDVGGASDVAAASKPQNIGKARHSSLALGCR